MPQIFISYRRGQNDGEAGRLFQDLKNAFGRRKVYIDVSSIRPGTNFRNSIEETIASSDIFLAVIGRDWVTVTDDKGRRRLDDPDDYVRFEISLALRGKVTVIPVLVSGAAPPSGADLPSDLNELSFLHAIELSHNKWESDVQHLIKTLRDQKPDRLHGWPKLLAAGAALVLALSAYFAVKQNPREVSMKPQTTIPIPADFPEEFGHIVAAQPQSVCELTGIHRNDGDGSYHPVSARERFLLYARCEVTGEMFPEIPRGAHSCCEHLSASDARALGVCPDAPGKNGRTYIRNAIRCPN